MFKIGQKVLYSPTGLPDSHKYLAQVTSVGHVFSQWYADIEFLHTPPEHHEQTAHVVDPARLVSEHEAPIFNVNYPSPPDPYKHWLANINHKIWSDIFKMPLPAEKEDHAKFHIFKEYDHEIAPPHPANLISNTTVGGDDKKSEKPGMPPGIIDILIETNKELAAKEAMKKAIEGTEKKIVGVDLASAKDSSAVSKIADKVGFHKTKPVFLSKEETAYAESLFSEYSKSKVFAMLANKKGKPGAKVIPWKPSEDEKKEFLKSLEGYKTYQEWLACHNLTDPIVLKKIAADYFDEKDAIAEKLVKMAFKIKPNFEEILCHNKTILDDLVDQEGKLAENIKAVEAHLFSIDADKINKALKTVSGDEPLKGGGSIGLGSAFKISDIQEGHWGDNTSVSVSTGFHGTSTIKLVPPPEIDGKINVIGASIVAIRKATPQEADDLGWSADSSPTVLELDNGVLIVASDAGLNMPLDLFASHDGHVDRLEPCKTKKSS